ncbi:MAG: hypothetical protein ABIQ31_17230 [Ferruginibacter sp.]
MKKFFKYTFIAVSGLGLVSIVSCKKNNLVVDKEVIAPAYAKFNTVKDADTIGTYYIKSDNTPFKLPVGVTNVSGADRTIQFTYTGTAAAGTQYTAPASIVIKAGQTLDSLTISGLFAGYSSSTRKDTLIISISGGDVPASAYKGVYRLVLRKYCTVVLPDFYGDYMNTKDGTYGPYFTNIVAGSAVSTGPTSGSINVTNVWDYYGVLQDMNSGAPLPSITINLDWADPANFKVTIPDQKFVTDDDIWIKPATTIGSFSSCDQTFTLRYTLYYKSTGLNYYANQVTIVTR